MIINDSYINEVLKLDQYTPSELLPVGTFKLFKGRTIDTIKPVKVYRNLHNGMYSIVQCGHVVAHAKTLYLSDVSFEVNGKGRQRVLQERRKNVHAFVVGTLSRFKCDTTKLPAEVSYNPYKSGNFYFVGTGTPIKRAECIVMTTTEDNKSLMFTC